MSYIQVYLVEKQMWHTLYKIVNIIFNIKGVMGDI